MVGPGGMTGWMGDDVWYVGVSESNIEGSGGSDGMTAELFGAPTINGDIIDFNPKNFQAEVETQSGENTSEIVDGQLSFMIVAKPGQVIDNVQFNEAGDTTLIALGAAEAFSSVSANFFVDVVEVDGQPLGEILNLDDALTFGPSDGDFEIGVDGSPNFNTAWSGSVQMDLQQALIDNDIDFQFGATKVNITLDNTLVAAASDGGSAFIKKKDFDGVTITVNVPEPGSVALVLLGVVGLVAARRVAG